MSGERLLAKGIPTSSLRLAIKAVTIRMQPQIVTAMLVAIGEKAKEATDSSATVFPVNPWPR